MDRLLESGALDRQVIEDLYLACLTREPTATEMERLEPLILQQPSRAEAFQALMWALISSREFAYNH